MRSRKRVGPLQRIVALCSTRGMYLIESLITDGDDEWSVPTPDSLATERNSPLKMLFVNLQLARFFNADMWFRQTEVGGPRKGSVRR